MQSRIVLVSDDSNFFDYVSQQLELRKGDEIFRYNFAEIPEKLHLLRNSALIVNSENSENEAIELLKIAKGIPALIFSFNDNEEYKIQVLRNGAINFVTPLMSEIEIKAHLKTVLSLVSILEKNQQYRELLEKNNLISKNNEVYIDYNALLDKELAKLDFNASTSVLVAISPDDKSKFLLQPNQIETIILNNIRSNDILMSYATNKYFLLLFDTTVDSAKKLWEKISAKIPEKIYAGFANTASKNRQQLVNEALNKLHIAINYEKNKESQKPAQNSNFKMFRQEFNKNFTNIITPVFYQIQQKYNKKLFGMVLEQNTDIGFGHLKIACKHSSAVLTVTCPGFSKINIDISYQTNKPIQPKRISFEPEEFDSGVLEDLLEQFITEFREDISDDKT